VAGKYYAWSKFPVEVNEWGQITKTIEPGDEITQTTLGVSDEEWLALVDSGAVRTEGYPDVPPNLSPAEHYAHQDAALIEGSLPEDEAKEVTKRQSTQAETEFTADQVQPEIPKARGKAE
jgi:hypothetical protein